MPDDVVELQHKIAIECQFVRLRLSHLTAISVRNARFAHSCCQLNRYREQLVAQVGEQQAAAIMAACAYGGGIPVKSKNKLLLHGDETVDIGGEGAWMSKRVS